MSRAVTLGYAGPAMRSTASAQLIVPTLQVLAMLACVASGASADASLEWRTPDGCPSASDAESEVERLLQAPLSTLDGHVHARVEITRMTSSAFEARVATHRGADVHELTLQDPSCLALTRAAALVVSLAVDTAKAAPRKRPRAERARTQALPVSEPVQPQAAPARERPIDAAVDRSAQPAAAEVELEYEPLPTAAARAAGLAASPSRDHATQVVAQPSDRAAGLRALAGAGVGVTAGVIPKLAPSALVSVGLDLGRVRTALRLGYTPAQTALLDGAAGGVGCEISLAQVALEAGISARSGRVQVPFLVGLEGGVFSAHSLGTLLQRSSRTAGWVAGYLGSGLALGWHEHLILTLRVEALLALRRPSFALEDERAVAHVVHRPELLNVRTYLALEVQFP